MSRHRPTSDEQRVFVFAVRVDPARVRLCLAHSLDHVSRDAFAKAVYGLRLEFGGVVELHRPGTDQRLIEEVFVIRGRRGLVVDDQPCGDGSASPTDEHAFPTPSASRRARQSACERPRRAWCRGSLSPASRAASDGTASCVILWKAATVVPKRVGSPPTSLLRDQSVVAVEGRILDALRRHRAGVLLEFHRQPPYFAPL